MSSRWNVREAWSLYRAGSVLVLVILAGTSGQAQLFRLESAGARFGIGAGNSAVDFHEAVAFLNTDLPGRANLGRQWWLQPRADLSLGWVGDPGHDAALGTLGPALIVGRPGLPVTFEAGSSPALLSRHQFGTKDLGTI